MRGLFLRSAAGILIVLLVSFLIVQWGTASLRESFQVRLSEALGKVLEARTRIDAAPASQLDAEAARFGADVGFPARLVDPKDATLPEAVRADPRHGPRLDFSGRPHGHGWTLYLPVRGASRVLVLGPARARLDRSYPVEAVAAGVLATVGLTAFLLAAPLVRRLRGLERAAARISEGDLRARAEAGKGDAIGRVAQRFNAMADRVQGLLERQQELLQAVSHELRTPAARIRFGLEMLEAAKSDEERQRRLDAIDDDLAELDQLVEELLFTMRAEQGAGIERRPLLVSDELDLLLERNQDLRPEITMVREEERGCRVLADQRYFRRSLQNLLGNGLRYARSRLTLEVAVRGEQIEIAFRDDGPGVPPEHRERIFQPFARIDDSRSRGSGGVGLGLAIVRRIVEAHGGSVTALEAPEGGVAFITRWPMAPAGEDTEGYPGTTQTRRNPADGTSD